MRPEYKMRFDLKTDRSFWLREANPWTYTPGEAYDLDLLPECGLVPARWSVGTDEYKQAQASATRRGQRAARAQEEAMREELDTHQHGPGCGHDHGHGHGQQSSAQHDPHQETRGVARIAERGAITRRNEPTVYESSDVHEDDMTQEEYDLHIWQQRNWDEWRDTHARGSGNPFFS